MTDKTYKLDVSDFTVSSCHCNLRELVWVIDNFISRLIQHRLYT